jgi:cytochrome c556
MSSLVRRAVAVLVVGGLAAVFTVNTQAQTKDKKYTISEIMKKGHAGSKSLISGIRAEAKAGNWDEAQNGAKLLKTFGDQLGTLSPEKGDEANWKKLTKKYQENTAAVAAAVEKKDAAGTNAALGKITGSCKECHASHKQ